jgi:hypothetical protein
MTSCSSDAILIIIRGWLGGLLPLVGLVTREPFVCELN